MLRVIYYAERRRRDGENFEDDDFRLPEFRTRTTFRYGWHKVPEMILKELTRNHTNHLGQGYRKPPKEVLATLASEHGACCHVSKLQGRKELLYDVVWTDELDTRGTSTTCS